jgi:hypothetical protein
MKLSTLLFCSIFSLSGYAYAQTGKVPAQSPKSSPASLSVINYASGGFNTMFPSVIVVDNGNVVANRAGGEAFSAMDALKKGEKVEDTPEQQVQLKQKIINLLTKENKTLSMLTGGEKSAILVMIPDSNITKCTECSKLMAMASPDGSAGRFKVREVALSLPPGATVKKSSP